MIRKALHADFQADIDGIQSHILDVTGDSNAALRRVREIDALVKRILENPLSGTRLDSDLEGCLRRSGGRDQKIVIVFEPFIDEGFVLFLLASFGGQNWSERAKDRL